MKKLTDFRTFINEWNGLDKNTSFDEVSMEKKGRSWYIKKNGELIKIPSVTTIVSSSGDIDAILAWRENLKKQYGEEQAKKIADHPKNRGSVMHKLLDVYFEQTKDMDEIREYCEKQWPKMPKEDWESGYNLFKQMVEDGICDRVYKTEEVEYPIGALDYGGYWGLIDFVATFRSGEKVIVDFKSANSKRMDETIDHYKKQLAAYCYAWKFMKHEDVHHAELWISYEQGDKKDEVIVLEPNEIKKYTGLFLEDVKEFHRHADWKIKRTAFESTLSDDDKREILKKHGIDYDGDMDEKSIKEFLKAEKGVKHGLTSIMTAAELDQYKEKYNIDAEIVVVLKNGNEILIEKEKNKQ